MRIEQFFSALPPHEMKKVIKATERAVAQGDNNAATLEEALGVMIEIYQSSK